MPRTMRILSIETSCDDTSIAIVEASGKPTKTAVPAFTVHKNIVSSQTAIHRHWGGVVPNLAKREHIKNLPKIFKSITSGYPLVASGLDMIAVTVGPGLEPALWTGIEFAKKLSAKLKVPLVGANHLEGHLYSFLLPKKTVNPKSEIRNPKRFELRASSFEFPAIALLVSGGHTMLLLMKDLLHWKLLGETRDDAVGEAFDKVARMMDLPYPGGPEIEKLALRQAVPTGRQAQGKHGNPQGTIKFPRPMMRENNYDFSFSGLKTAVLYYLKNKSSTNNESGTNKRIRTTVIRKFENNSLFADVAASFQSAAIDVLTTKTVRAVREFGAQSVILCGGVAANTALRESLTRAAGIAGATFIAPAKEYNTDNAAMIAAAAYINTFRKKKYPMAANGNLGI